MTSEKRVKAIAWLRSLGRRLIGTWTGPSDDVFTPAGWDLEPGSEDGHEESGDGASPEVSVVSGLLRDCEMPTGCRCGGHCGYVRALIWTAYGHADLTDTDRALLDRASIDWNPEAQR